MIKDLEESIYTAYDVVRGQIDAYYNNSIKDYSMIDKAFKKKDEIIVYEYYLHIDYSNDEVCKKYYGEEGYTVSFKAVKNVEKFIEELKGDLGYEEE